MTGAPSPGGLERGVVRIFILAACLAVVLPTLPRLGAVAGAIGLALALGAAWLAWQWVLDSLAGSWRRRPVVSALWALSAVLALLQVGRLSAFMADPDRVWGSVVPDPIAADHACLSAYIVAADLSRRGTHNLYDERFYPAFAGDAARLLAPGHIRNLKKWMDDPYEYPPPFLVFPRAALLVTDDFLAIRAGWFVLQALGLVVVGAWLARWVGGRDGQFALLLLPLLLASLPTMLGLQFGQFHVATLVLSVAAMICFEERRPAVGGALLAVATVSKLFPAFLLVFLLGRRRWREVAWTLGACVVFSIVGLAVLGWSPFEAFLGYQLPRIHTGEAFSFYEHQELVVSRNLGIPGLVTKLHFLGLTAMNHGAGALLGWLFTFLLVWMAWTAGRRAEGRLAEARVWLALLSLGALRSPLAPPYVTMSMLWLLTLLAGEIRGRAAWVAGFVVTWALIMGPPPLTGTTEFTISSLGQLAGLAVCVWGLLGPRAAASDAASDAAAPALSMGSRTRNQRG
jgi:alpha-1,2-mannosyltransferase